MSVVGGHLLRDVEGFVHEWTIEHEASIVEAYLQLARNDFKGLSLSTAYIVWGQRYRDFVTLEVSRILQPMISALGQ